MHETRSLPHDSASRGKSLAMAPRHWPMPRAASLMCVKMKMHIRASAVRRVRGRPAALGVDGRTPDVDAAF